MKTYEDLEGDGGSNIVGQVVQLGEKLRSRLDKIKHTVALMSGKGGVGKSSITANIASCLADRGHKVGILDADLNGPSIGHLLGVGNDLKLKTKDEERTFIEADEEVRELKGKVEYYAPVVEYLQELVKSISNRSFQIKNAIEWRKFEAGI